MSASCHSDLDLQAILSSQVEVDEQRAAHLSQCARCRARLAEFQTRRGLPGFSPEQASRRAPWQRHWLPALASLVVAVALWQLLPPAVPDAVMRTAQPSRSLQALERELLPAGAGLRLSWSPLADARSYRLGCYRGDQPAWLQRQLQEPSVSIDATTLASAGQSSCRLDAELATGGWVLGDEQIIQP